MGRKIASQRGMATGGREGEREVMGRLVFPRHRSSVLPGCGFFVWVEKSKDINHALLAACMWLIQYLSYLYFRS